MAQHADDLSHRRRDERLSVVVHDTNTVDGFLAWLPNAPNRNAALTVARANIDAGHFSAEDVQCLVDAGLDELRPGTSDGLV